MHISLILLTPVLICLWLYFLIIITENLLSYPPTSVQLNILNKNNVTENVLLKENISNADTIKIDNNNGRKESVHVPKYMLELYEKNRKEGKNLQNSDVVKSLIPTHAGKYKKYTW